MSTAPSAAPTLTEVLLARGYEHRPAGHGAHDIVRISDGVVVTTLKAHEAWEWIRGFDLGMAAEKAATPKRHRHDFRDADVYSNCDAARGAA